MLTSSTTITIAKKELRSFFNSPVAYIVVTVFLLLWEYLFFRNAILVGEASLRSLFSIFPWLSLLLVPAVTMGSVSQEKNDETLEFVLTHPVRDRQFIMGKFLGSFKFLAVPILFTIPLAIWMNAYGNLDWGAFTGQFLATLFMIAVLTSLGIFISSIFSNQISSFLVTAIASLLLIILGFEFVTASLPIALGVFFERLSVLSHFQSMSRGVVDIRDMWYFLTTCLVFLSLGYWQLTRRRGGRHHGANKKTKTAIVLLIVVSFFGNIFGSSIPGRLDLTESKAYSLASGTKKLLSGLVDPVQITLYSSGSLPSQFQPTLRDTKDILRDYQTYGRGKVEVTLKNTDTPEMAQEAQQGGIQEVQFNVVGQAELQVKKGFLGLAVKRNEARETIPFIQTADDLEYQLSSFIQKLTATEKKDVKFLTGHGEKNVYSDFQLFTSEAGKQFNLDTLTIDEKNPAVPTTTDVLVLSSTQQPIPSKHKDAIKSYLSAGNPVLFMVDGVSVNPQFLTATSTETSVDTLLAELGITLDHNLVYDLRSQETIGFNGGGINYFLPYPYWMRTVPGDPSSPITSGIQSVVVPWASQLIANDTIVSEKGYSVQKTLTTSPYAGIQQAPFSIAPDTNFSQENLSTKVIAITLTKQTDAGKESRIMIIGDSEFLMDQFIQNHPENLAFGMNALSWLAQEDSLAGIKVRQGVKRNLTFANETQASLLKWGNLAIVVLLPLGFGLFRLLRRRGLRKFTYSSTAK